MKRMYKAREGNKRKRSEREASGTVTLLSRCFETLKSCGKRKFKLDKKKTMLRDEVSERKDLFSRKKIICSSNYDDAVLS
jgi:hypothetical protein